MRSKQFTYILLFTLLQSYSFGQRLTLSIDELKERKCQIVENYFEYKKHVLVITNDSYEPYIRNANEIALFRLLHKDFTTTDLESGNREIFIRSLKSKTDNRELLKKDYTTFDCPNFDFIKSFINDFDKNTKIEGMDIIDSGIKTTKYYGWMLFAEEEYESYSINESFFNPDTKGINKNAEVKKLHYEIYPLDSFLVVLKIIRIEKVTQVETVYQKDSLSAIGMKYEKVKPKEFVPCCDQPSPRDSDGDFYNVLVDCDDNNLSIYPGAPEILADGIDQDCDGVDQYGEDKDGDGFYYSACESNDPEIRKLCDCFEGDPDVYYRDKTVPENEWFIPSNGWNDDNRDCVKDRIVEIPWTNLSPTDYAIPGKGHFKRGPSKDFVRKGTAYAYAIGFLSTTGYSIYSKMRSNQHYSTHRDSETFRNANIELQKAQSHNKRFLISAGISALIFAAHSSHLGIKDKLQKKYRKETLEGLKARPLDSKICLVPELKLINHNNNIGIGLIFNLNK